MSESAEYFLNNNEYKRPMKRRDLIKQILYTSLGGTVGLHVIEEYLRGVPSSQFSSSSLDAFDFLRKANHFGYQNKVWQPQAYAAPSDGVNIIFIRVMNLIHTPLYFKFLDYTGTNSSRAWEKNVPK